MLARTFEFLRIANAKPAAEIVTSRRDAAAKLAKQLAAPEFRDVMLGCVQGVVAGFNSSSSQMLTATETVLAAIKEHDAAFPSDLRENAVEVRATAATAVGELLLRDGVAGPSHGGMIAGLALKSGLGPRPPAKEKHIRAMLDVLLNASDETLAVAARERREEGSKAFRALEGLKLPADPPEALKVLITSVAAALREMKANAAADREELDVLWWMFGGYSEKAQKEVSELPPAIAALCAGVEIADRCLLPCSPSGAELVRRMMKLTRGPSSGQLFSVQDLVRGWTEPIIDALSTAEVRQANLATKFPVLLPLSWACSRLQDLRGSTKMGKEFEVATGIPLNCQRSAADWGEQAFHERILQRVVVGAKG